MKQKFNDILNDFTFSKLVTRQSILDLVLLLAVSVIIGYIISPKSLFLPTVYHEGDVFLQNVVIEEDLLVPDLVSTRLKKEKLIKEQSPIFEFDPTIRDKTINQVTLAFETTRQEFQNIDQQLEENRNNNFSLGRDYLTSIQSRQELKSTIDYYSRYKAIIQDRLEKFNKEDKLSTREFERKQKLEADLSTVSQIVDESSAKLAFYAEVTKKFPERFIKAEQDQKELQESIELKKEAIASGFLKSLHLDLEDPERRFLIDQPYYSQELQTDLIRIISGILSKKIVSSKDISTTNGNKNIEIHNLETGQVTKMVGFQDLNEIQEIKEQIVEAAKHYFVKDETGIKRNLLVLMATKLVRPTVNENKLEFEKRKEQLIGSMSPVYFSVKKGEVIARAGDRATRHQVDLINSYYNEISKVDNLPRLFGVILIAFVSLKLVALSFHLRGESNQVTPRKMLLLVTAILVTLLLVKAGVLIGDLVESRYAAQPREIYVYILPIALSSMLVGILLNYESALLVGLLTSLFASFMMQGSLNYFFFAILASLVASLPLTKFESRYSLLNHGLKVSIVNVSVVFIIYLIGKNQMGHFNWQDIVAAFMGGIVTAIIASIILPFFETLFDITTNLKLLELSNMNHPALKELIFKAPGTYQHSIVVGNLAESGADRIGANPLLARVASYYHDIGKTEDPQYYIENQAPNSQNIHDFLDPFESADIIIDHIRKGTKKADKYRLGSAITDIVTQHHGTRLVEYFFNKAVKKSEHQAESPIDENHFRYRGPRPQNLEAALVMLADIAEAACRSLDDPTPESIREMVERVSWKVLEDGQLNESGLTLETYHQVIEEYCTVLINIHHHRIKYPESAKARQTPSSGQTTSLNQPPKLSVFR